MTIKRYPKKRGFALITALMIIVIMIIISTALIATSTNTLFMIGNYSLKKQAISLAESGINEAIAHLLADKNWTGNLPDALTSPPPLKNADYYVTFTPQSDKLYSVNNLTSSTTSIGYDGRIIPPYSANIVCVAKIGGLSRVVDVFIQPGSDSDSPLIVDNQIIIALPTDGSPEDGIFNFLSENSGKANIHSNYDEFDPSIKINGNSVHLNQQELTTRGISVDINPSPTDGIINTGVSYTNIPSPPDKPTLDSTGISNTIPSGTFTRVNGSTYNFVSFTGETYTITDMSSPFPGITVSDGRLVINQNQSVSGPVTVEGNIEFQQGAYMELTNEMLGKEGTLTVKTSPSAPTEDDGIITGNGSVVAGMDVNFSVNQPLVPSDTRNKINIFADNTVTMASASNRLAEFSGMIYAGEVVVDIKDTSGNLNNFNFYGAIYVSQNTIELQQPDQEQVVEVEEAPALKKSIAPAEKKMKSLAKSITIEPLGLKPPPVADGGYDDGGVETLDLGAPKMMLKSIEEPLMEAEEEELLATKETMVVKVPMPPIVINTSGNFYMDANNFNLTYDEDYLNQVNSRQTYTNYNISSWVEYNY